MVITWAAWEVLAVAGKVGHSSLTVSKLGENSRKSGQMTTWGGGLTEAWGGFVSLLDIFVHFGRDP